MVKTGDHVRFRLRDKILFFSVLLALLPLIVSSTSMITVTRDELKSSVNDSLINTAEQLVREIDETFVRAWQTLLLMRSAVDSPDLGVDEKVSLLHSSIASIEDFSALQLVVAEGASVFFFKQDFKQSLDEAQLAPDELLRPPGVNPFTLPDKNQVTVGDPLFIMPLDTWLLPLWMPLQQTVSGQSAALLVHVDLRHLRQILETHSFNKIGKVWLIDAHGRRIFDRRQQNLSAHPLVEMAERLMESGLRAASVTPFQGRDGEMMLGSFAVANHLQWAVLVTLRETDAYLVVTKMLNYLSFWLVIGLIVAAGGAMLFSRRISRPVVDITQVASQVKQGNLKVRVRELKTHDETSVLGKRINEMIGGLFEKQTRLDYLAFHDPLTGLPNRWLLHDRLQQAIVKADRCQDRVALLFLDLDRFKHINDTLGHDAGDRLLKLVARRLRECLREEDTVARLGGDEFMVVLGGVKHTEAVSLVADKIIAAFSHPFKVGEYELYVGASIGISMCPQDGREGPELIKNADIAMYLAKEQGRGNYQFFTETSRHRMMRQLTLDSRLRRALKKEELEIYYQPQVELQSGRIISMEALVRWPDPEVGFVAQPTEFIPLAEETGLIVALGEWVMRTTCAQTKTWHDAGFPKLVVAVNLSAQQFRRQDLLRSVKRTLTDTGLEGGYLELELTESILVEDTEQAIKVMGSLKRMGVQLSIDDFGTGYSSLSYLKRFPLDFLKVAQEFVRDITIDPNDAAIAKAVISLAKSLGLKVIAEGVETAEHLDFFQRHQCDLVQGYFFSRPLPADRFEKLIQGIEHNRYLSLPGHKGIA